MKHNENIKLTQLLQLRKDKLFIAVFLAIIIAMTYAGGLMAQLINNSAIWQQAGGMFDTSIKLQPISFNPITAVTAIAKSSQAMILFVVIMLIALWYASSFYLRWIGLKSGTEDEERNFVYSDKGTYGTARWMSDEKRGRTFHECLPDQTTETILGKRDANNSIDEDNKIAEEGRKRHDVVLCTPSNTMLNRHIAIYGASGSGKSRCFSRVYMFQAAARGESLIFTDPKGELYESMAGYLADKGYIVKVFNLVSPERSNSWNILDEIKDDELNAQILADIIIKNTNESGKEDFWTKGEMNVLKAAMLYVSLTPEWTGERSLGGAYNFLCTTNPETLDAIFSRLPDSHPAKMPYMIFAQSQDKVKSGILIGFGSRLQVFQNRVIRTLTSTADIDLTLPGKEKCAYFCIMSDQMATLSFLSALFFSFLFIDLVKYADVECGGKLPVPVNFVLDEFPNIGQIPDFTKKISTVRSRGINISVIFQALSQLENRYPFGQWEEILANCDTQIVLGANDGKTQGYVSDKTGIATINVVSKSQGQTGGFITMATEHEFKQSHGEGKRQIMDPTEVGRLGSREELVFIRGEQVLKTNKFDYLLHPEAKYLRTVRIKDFVAPWAVKKDDDDSTAKPSEVTEMSVQMLDDYEFEIDNASEDKCVKETIIKPPITKTTSEDKPKPPAFTVTPSQSFESETIVDTTGSKLKRQPANTKKKSKNAVPDI